MVALSVSSEHMNFELAKQLKDAGFPQNTKHKNITKLNGVVGVPTLSELIEVCPKVFKGEKFTLDWWDIEKQWRAWYEFIDGFGDGPSAYGETPEIAVANLYLELKKNNER